MQADYPSHFVREMGCKPHEFTQWLQAALTEYVWQCQATQAWVDIPQAEGVVGRLCLQWQVLPDRCIALIRIPRLEVRYAFEGVSDADRKRFMQRLDLFMQRGGG